MNENRRWDREMHVVSTQVADPFYPQGWSGSIEFKVCRLCGSLVADQDLHDLWHVRLASPQTYR